MRPLLAIIGASTLAATLAVATATRTGPPPATASSSSSPPPPLILETPYATADPAVTSRVDAAGAFGRIALEDRLDRTRRVASGLRLPIDGVAFPTDPDLLPNAPRDYRAGWHEGIDFPAERGTPVRAVAAGTVSRVDHDFTDWTREQQDLALSQATELGFTPSATLDRIRGRQVWIDHGNGIVSRYAHLDDVADVTVGSPVPAGTLIGFVGSTGYPAGGPHLHLEVRLGQSYLGDGLAGDALIAAVAGAFDYMSDGAPRSR
jgi:murein DD-endopeptidase MepM/ murein hydrolase activator NlpD